MLYRRIKLYSIFLYALVLREDISSSIVALAVNLTNVCVCICIIVIALYIHLDNLDAIRNDDGILIGTVLDIVSS